MFYNELGRSMKKREPARFIALPVPPPVSQPRPGNVAQPYPPPGPIPKSPLPEPVEGRFSSAGSPTEMYSGQPAEMKSVSLNLSPVCPKCGQPMVLRIAETGVNTGKQFWGCVNYPK